jgi:hypothetical protein
MGESPSHLGLPAAFPPAIQAETGGGGWGGEGGCYRWLTYRLPTNQPPRSINI